MMIDTKQKAKYILEDYANCYSQVDLEQLAKYLDEIKAEAYKEFAEKLKKEMKICLYGNYISQPLKRMVVEDIDNLLKELVGDK